MLGQQQFFHISSLNCNFSQFSNSLNNECACSFSPPPPLWQHLPHPHPNSQPHHKICRGLDSTHGLATAADVVVFIIILKGLKLFHDGSFWLFSVRSVCVLNMMDECACASHSAQSLTLSQSKI